MDKNKHEEYTYLNWHELEERVDRMIAAQDLAAFAIMNAILEEVRSGTAETEL